MDLFILIVAAVTTAAFVAGWTLAAGPYLMALKAKDYDRKAFLRLASGRNSEYGAALVARWKKGAMAQIGCYLAIVASLVGDGLRNPDAANVEELMQVAALMYVVLWMLVLAIEGIAVFLTFWRFPERQTRMTGTMDGTMSRANGFLIVFCLLLFLLQAVLLFFVGPGMVQMALTNQGAGSITDNRSYMIFMSGLAAMVALVALVGQVLMIRLLPQFVALSGRIAQRMSRDR